MKKNKLVIVGAGGLAKQILDVIERFDNQNEIYFFDNITVYEQNPQLFNFQIIQDIETLKTEEYNNDELLILGIGKPSARKFLYQFFTDQDLKFRTVISTTSLIGKHDVHIGDGCVVMERVSIESSVTIGKGVLLNTGVKVFHDTTVGDFCELAPSCKILGKCKIGTGVFIGANATILPGVEIGDDAVIGAGAVVTKNVMGGVLIKGVPGR